MEQENEVEFLNSRTLVIPHKTVDNIVQSNTLVHAAYSLSIDQMRLIYLAMNKIDNPVQMVNGLVPAIEITPQEFRDTFNIKSNTVWKRLDQLADTLFDKKIVTHVTDSRGRQTVDKQRWFSFIKYSTDDASASIQVRFAPELIPYLYDFSDNFTKLDFKEVAKLDTPFAMRFYSYLSQFRRFHKYRKENGVIQTPEIQVETLKEQFGFAGKYEEFGVFRRDVLNPAIKKITQQTDLAVSFETVSKGRKVVALVFCILDQKDGMKIKPIKKRLPPRPKCTTGSQLEWQWFHKCIDILEKYRIELKEYDPEEELTKADLTKLIGYYQKIMEPTLAHRYEDILESLNAKSKKTRKKS